MIGKLCRAVCGITPAMLLGSRTRCEIMPGRLRSSAPPETKLTE